jgi:alpha-ribazole phosphatase
MQLYLIRHTAPDIQPGICYGQSDILLKNTFESEWELLKINLPLDAEIIFSSPLSRCLTLATKIGSHLNLKITTDVRLMEMNFGRWELRDWNDIDQVALHKWMNNYQSEKCPDGECYEDVLVRVKTFLEHLKETKLKSVVVVTHAGVIKLAESILNPHAAKNVLAMKVAYGGIYKYELGI